MSGNRGGRVCGGLAPEPICGKTHPTLGFRCTLERGHDGAHTTDALPQPTARDLAINALGVGCGEHVHPCVTQGPCVDRLETLFTRVLAGDNGYAECKRRAQCVVEELFGVWYGMATHVDDGSPEGATLRREGSVAVAALQAAVEAIKKL